MKKNEKHQNGHIKRHVKSIYLTEEVIERVNREAALENRTFSSYIANLLIEHFNAAA